MAVTVALGRSGSC